jgi:hypothetical protein
LLLVGSLAHEAGVVDGRQQALLRGQVFVELHRGAVAGQRNAHGGHARDGFERARQPVGAAFVIHSNNIQSRCLHGFLLFFR